MENSNTREVNPIDSIGKIKEQTSIGILIQDLTSASNLMSCETKKDLTARIIKVLNENYLKRERDIVTKHLFNFYAELSRQMNVPENLISENLTHAENYFDKIFNEQK